MITFEHEIKDELGLHARPAGLLVKLASQYASDITLQSGAKSANAKKLFQVMGLGTKGGSMLAISISGPDEQDAHIALAEYLDKNI